MSKTIFVYGSLKKGFINHSRLKNSEFIGVAKTIEKYEMYKSKYGNWPYLIKDQGMGSSIKGELFSVSDTMLKAIDEFEGHPDYYKRETVKIKLIESDEIIDTEIYIFVENERDDFEIPYSEWFES